MKDLRTYASSKINVLEMQKYLGISDYIEFADVVRELAIKGIIRAVKSSKTNGKKPSLFNNYTIVKKKTDYSDYEDELKYKLNYELNTGYYLRHIEQYITDRGNIQKLSNFLNIRKELLDEAISINERSFQIWGKEKFLGKEGRTLLKRLGFNEEKLNYYDTTEPLAYYAYSKSCPQNVIMVENKDTFYTIRRYMLNGSNLIFGMEFGTVIYGAGKGINKSLKDFEISLEPFLINGQNRFYYLGDIDYEGIKIYELLHDNFKKSFDIMPFNRAYEYMVDKAISAGMELPLTKEGQNRNIGKIFLDCFPGEYKEKIISILLDGRYIPQEIINYADLKLRI